jgi:drug/metabolite transporter (DMT)-like permease
MAALLGAAVLYRGGAGLFAGVPWRWLVPAALGDVLGFALFNLAVTAGDVSYVTAILSGQSIVTVGLSCLFFGERLRGYQIAGIALVLAGLISAQW